MESGKIHAGGWGGVQRDVVRKYRTKKQPKLSNKVQYLPTIKPEQSKAKARSRKLQEGYACAMVVYVTTSFSQLLR